MIALCPRARWLTAVSEGCRLRAYRDGGGVWSVGYGQTGPGIGPGLVWTQDRADQALGAHLMQFATWVWPYVYDVPTTTEQFGALVDAAYNAGPGSLKKSPMIAAHRAGDYAGAAAAFLPWHILDHAGNLEPGLPKRRHAESALYAGDLTTFDALTGYKP